MQLWNRNGFIACAWLALIQLPIIALSIIYILDADPSSHLYNHGMTFSRMSPILIVSAVATILEPFIAGTTYLLLKIGSPNTWNQMKKRNLFDDWYSDPRKRFY